jgi:hypothetical protein
LARTFTVKPSVDCDGHEAAVCQLFKERDQVVFTAAGAVQRNHGGMPAGSNRFDHHTRYAFGSFARKRDVFPLKLPLRAKRHDLWSQRDARPIDGPEKIGSSLRGRGRALLGRR